MDFWFFRCFFFFWNFKAFFRDSNGFPTKWILRSMKISGEVENLTEGATDFRVLRLFTVIWCHKTIVFIHNAALIEEIKIL